MAAEVIEVKAGGDGVFGVGPDGLEEQKGGIAMFDVESIKHAILEDFQRDFLPVAREIAVVGQSIETRARSAGYRHVQSAM